MGVAMTKIQLVGAKAYSYKGMKFARNKAYMVARDRAKILLTLETDLGFRIFKEVGKPFEPMARKPVPIAEENLEVIDTSKTEADVFEEEQLQKAMAEDEDDTQVEVEAASIPDPAEDQSDAPFPEPEAEGGTPV